MSSSLHTTVVLDALQMAATQRRPAGVIHHSDQGTQYGALAFGQRCKTLGVRPSMGSRGDAYDNAMAESFFGTLECELLARRRFASHAEARLAIFRYVEGWYNPHRRHSALGQQSPLAFERAYAARAASAPTPTPSRLDPQALTAPRKRGKIRPPSDQRTPRVLRSQHSVKTGDAKQGFPGQSSAASSVSMANRCTARCSERLNRRRHCFNRFRKRWQPRRQRCEDGQLLRRVLERRADLTPVRLRSQRNRNPGRALRA